MDNKQETVAESKISYLRICKVMRDSKQNPGTKFPDYFAIFLTETDSGLKPVQIMIEGKMHNRSIKCHVNDDCMKKLEKLGTFPFDVSVDSNRRVREGVSDYVITIDKESKTKQPRLDKNGKTHSILILQDFINAVPSKTLTIEDFLKGEGE